MDQIWSNDVKSVNEIKDLLIYIRKIKSDNILEILNFSDSSGVRIWNKLISQVLVLAAVPEFKAEDQEYVRTDFNSVLDNAVCAFQLINLVLMKLQELGPKSDSKQTEVKNLVTNSLPKLLMFCAAHSNANFLWSSAEIVALASETETILCSLLGYENLEDAFKTDDDDSDSMKCDCVFGDIIENLQPKLKKESWKKNPSLKHIFRWCALKLSFPHLGKHLDFLLPISLIMTDDYKSDHKVLGIECLEHVVRNSSAAELGWYGRVDVIYDTLYHQMYTHEAPVVKVLHPCMLRVLAVVERSPREPNDKQRKWCRYDDVLIQLMQDMQFESKIVLRRLYSGFLKSYIEVMGITVVKHTQTLMKVFTDYLEQYDGPEETARLNILAALQSYISHAWPCVASQSTKILKSLLKFVYDVSVDRSLTPENVKCDLVSTAEDCLILLNKATKGHAKELLAELENEESLNDICEKFINSLSVSC